MGPEDIAKQIIDSSYYLTLATTAGEKPWANAVFFAVDKKYNFFFTSYNDSQHVQNILKNPNVAVAIFDSHIIPGTGAQGVQIEGTCHRLTKEELPEAIEIVYSKRFPDSQERAKRDLSVEHFSKPGNDERADHIYIRLAENLSFQAEDESKRIHTSTARLIKLGKLQL